MKERIQAFLRAENKSSAQFAEEIGVQPSGISHIISGRNNPSLDFVIKMLDKYKYLSTEWLLFGKGAMYRDNQLQNLFDSEISSEKSTDEKPVESEKTRHTLDFNGHKIENDDADYTNEARKESFRVVKIVWFYNNNSFEEFFPRS